MSNTRVALAEAAARLSRDKPFEEIFADGQAISVELYAPVGVDKQTPHDRDEIYIVAEGTGHFVRGAEKVSFGPGDFLYVPAHVPHRFEDFSADFKTWVIFYGAPRQAAM